MPKKLLSLLCAALLLLGTVNTSALAGDAPSPENPFASADRHRGKTIAEMKTPQKGDKGDAAAAHTQKSATEKQTAAAAPQSRYIVKFKDDVALAEIHEGIKDYDFSIIGDSARRMFTLPADSVEAVKAFFGEKIEFAEEDALIQSDAITTDPYVQDQWALPAIKAPQAWATTKGSNQVYVAVIDSGWDTYHEDLVNSDIRAGYDFIFESECDWDSTGHGTAVTGIVAATANNGIGISGVCWNVAIIPLRVIWSDGTLYTSDACRALYAAADIGCDVINMSYGGQSSLSEAIAVQYALSKGCILVGAAGNDGSMNYEYPASYDGVISASSVNSGLAVSSFSQKNDRVDVAAPGENVLSTFYDYTDFYAKYAYVSGTSFAAPYVSAVAALVRSINPTINSAAFLQALQATSTDLGPTGYDTGYGYGLINAQAVLAYIISTQGSAQYTVTFDSQGGSPVAAITASAGALIAAPTAPALPGYTFAGWYRDAAGTSPWNFSTDAVGANTTLYARWTPNSYTVRFDTQGGSGIADIAASYNTLIAAPPTPTRTGYTFTGWFQDSGCTLPWNFAANTITADRTLFAGWSAQPPSNYLRGIGLSTGSLNRGFSAKVTSYTVTLGENAGAVTITPAKAFDGATMTIDNKKVASKTVALANGKSTTVTVKVTWNKKTTAYKLKVQRAKSTASTLAALSATAGVWSQAFDPAVGNYTLTLPQNVGKVTLKAARASALATVSPASKAFTLKNGQTVKATFKVKAQSGATRTYTVTITRAKSTNANLASLKLNAKGMTPGFHPATTGYAITLPAKTASLTIAAKAADPLAIVRINGAKRAALTVKLANGQSTQVTVTVTAQSGDVKNYVIAVSRQ